MHQTITGIHPTFAIVVTRVLELVDVQWLSAPDDSE